MPSQQHSSADSAEGGGTAREPVAGRGKPGAGNAGGTHQHVDGRGNEAMPTINQGQPICDNQNPLRTRFSTVAGPGAGVLDAGDAAAFPRAAQTRQWARRPGVRTLA